MLVQPLAKTAILTLLIVSISVISWELYLRNKGVPKAYDDGPAQWAEKRTKVYEPADKATVFIGSSRIKYDLDIDTWQTITGEAAIQLAEEGSSPMLTLEDLANDEKFKGKLIVDITEPLFFSPFSPRDAETINNIKFFKSRTPAQRAGFELNDFLESKLIFLDKDFYSLNAMLDNIEIPRRKGVFTMPLFPMEFARATKDRQSKMSDKFVVDTLLQNKVKAIWLLFAEMGKRMPPISEEAITGTLKRAKSSTDKIKARGGQVLFVRTPSSGPLGIGENMGFPREKFWNRILSFTECPGVHYMDYPVIAHFNCPEWSHLSPADAVVFTKQFIDILEKEKGWKFSKPVSN
ncbi:MAG TPA: hypothetical protein VMY77_01680 [Chitinophagaceae bacterium]|nr:hypothetical protein [Chitinophagaceae bacterium]